MKRFNTALVLSVLLHAGVFGLAYVSWKTAPKPLVVASVPIELVSDVPMREQAEAPVDEQAVKTPEPEPAPPEPVVEPKPEPAPKLPVPAPQKPATPKPEPKPEKKPEPKPEPKPAKKPEPKSQAKAPPDPKGTKKPEPPKQAKPSKPAASKADDLLSRLAATPSQSSSKKPAQANTRRTDGRSNQGTAPADAGTQTALTALTNRLRELWNPNCDVPGARLVSPEIGFTISANGRVVRGPEWLNRRNDAVWQAAASRAMSAVKQGELYDDLPKELYNRPLEIVFDGKSACGG